MELMASWIVSEYGSGFEAADSAAEISSLHF